MPGIVLDQGAIFIHFEPFGAQGDGLVEPDMPTNHDGFTDDDASPVVNKKTFADFRSRMDVDRCLRMGDLRNDPREHRDAQPIELVRETMTNDRGDARVAKHDLVEALGRGITLICGVDVGIEQRADLGQPQKRILW